MSVNIESVKGKNGKSFLANYWRVNEGQEAYRTMLDRAYKGFGKSVSLDIRENKMSWVRLHALPRICRKDTSEWGAKEFYLYKKSRERYFSTDDGKYVAGIAENFIPEIGRVESVRFIESI